MGKPKVTDNTVENALEEAGDCGLYHIWLMMLVVVPCIMVGANVATSVFEDMIPSYRCDVNYTDWLNQTCNITVNDGRPKFQHSPNDKNPECYRYSFTNVSTVDCHQWQSQLTKNNSRISLTESDFETCDRWTYDRSDMRETTVTEFSLVCGSTWAGYISQSSFMFGVLMGSVAMGWIAERWGRRRTFLLFGIGSFAFGVATAFVRTYVEYVVLRCLFGFFLYNTFPILFILVSELIVARRRAVLAQYAQFLFAVGYMVLTAMAFITRHWRSLQLCLSIPCGLSIILWWFLPESPRWLIANRKRREALKVVTKIQRVNTTSLCGYSGSSNGAVQVGAQEVPLTERDEREKDGCDGSSTKNNQAKNEDNTDRVGSLDMYRRKKLRSMSMVVSFQWFSVSCVYYGLTLNAAQLGGDPFLNMFFNGLAESVSVLLVIPVLNCAGRRFLAVSSQIVAGIFCIILFVIPGDTGWLLIVCSIIGKFAIASSFSVMYLHTGELYPTTMRSVAIGVCNAWARLGGIASPLIAMIGLLAPSLPYAIFATVSIVSGVLMFTVPETTNHPLLETIEEGEEFIAKHSRSLGTLIGRLCKSKSSRATEVQTNQPISVGATL